MAAGQTDEDFSHVNREYTVAIGRATSGIGWNGRGLINEQSADFHWITRELRWRRFCIEVRDQIIATLGGALAQAGRAFGESPKLVVRNLPSLADVDESERKLREGGTRFDVLLKPFRRAGGDG